MRIPLARQRAAAALSFAVLGAGVLPPRAAAQQATSGVFAQRFDARGEALAGELAVAANEQAEETPAIAALDGGFVIVWSALAGDLAANDVFAQRFAADGAPLGTQFPINSHTTAAQDRPAVAAAGDGGFFVVWDSVNQDGAGRGVFGQIFAADGERVGSEIQINAETAGGQRRAAVAATADDGFVVVWESDAQDGSDLGVFGRRFATDGSALGGDFLINTYTPGAQQQAAVASEADGGFVVAWESAAQDNYGRGVFAQRFDATDAVRGGEFRVNTNPIGGQRRPALAGLVGGGFVAVWDNSGQDGGGRGVFAQRFAANGAFQGAEMQVNTHTANDQVQAQVAADADGGFIVAWQSFGQDGNSDGIYAQRFSAQGERSGDEIRVNTETRQRELSVDLAAGADGGFAAVWERRPYCPGDCDGDRRVAVGELIQAVGVALGRADADDCRDADANGDAAVSIAELTRAVRSALAGCA